MADSFTFELVSPAKLVFSGDAIEVTVPGSDGYFTVMGNHAPFMTTLRPGTVEAKLADGTEMKILVLGGLADISPNGFTLLAEFASPVEEVTSDMLSGIVASAEEAASKATGDEGKQMAEEKLAQLNEVKATLGL